MPSGMVKWFNEMKNYGFIIPDEGGRDIFFHRSDMKAAMLREGQKVTYSLEEGRKGPVAVAVTPSDGEGNFFSPQSSSFGLDADYSAPQDGGFGSDDGFQTGDVDYFDQDQEPERPPRYERPAPPRHREKRSYSPRPSYRAPRSFPSEEAPRARTSTELARLLGDSKSMCDAIEELAISTLDEKDAEALKTQMLNISVLARSAREKLDETIDEFSIKNM